MKRWGNVLTHGFLALFTLATLYPLLLVLKIAFSPGKGVSSSPGVIPDEFTLDHFREVVGTTDSQGGWLFGQQLWNSVVISVATTFVGIFIACTAAYAFSRFTFTGRRAGLVAFLVSQMFPGVMMMIPLYILIGNLGLLDNQLGLILVYSTTAIPFCVWMLKGYFDTIPKELEESAIIDGASRFTVFWRIIMPLSAPAVAVTALFSFMTAWNEFILAFTFMNKPESFTLPVTIQRYVGEHDIQWPLIAAASVLVSIPVMTLFFALQKYLVGGLTAGAVKG
ncbi:MAG: ABC transporter permease [Myxococcales bacterium]